MNLTKTQRYLLAGGGAAVLIAAAAAAVWFGRDAVDAGSESETTATTEASWTVEPTATAGSAEGSGTAPSEQPLAPTQPSYGRYAHILSVEGVPGNYSVVVDFFDIYTEDAADKYADEHGLTVPSNGILYVDEEQSAERIPLRSDVAIIYKAGGVESLVQLTATVEQLREWTLGHTSALDGAVSDQWDVTVEQGIVARIEMVAIAD